MTGRTEEFMCKIYFVDMENVGSSFLNGVDVLTGKDKLFVFHNEERDKECSNNILSALISLPVKKDIIHVPAKLGKNAIDFQIVAYLGACIEKYKLTAQYYIVSRDQGYLSAIKAFENIYDIKVNLVVSCNSDMEEERMRSIVQHKLSAYTSKKQNKIITILKQIKTDDVDKKMVMFHNAIVHTFPQEASYIYHTLREDVARYYGIVDTN